MARVVSASNWVRGSFVSVWRLLLEVLIGVLGGVWGLLGWCLGYVRAGVLVRGPLCLGWGIGG